MKIVLISGMFFIIWWLTLFAVLPVGVKVPKKIGKGHANSAPSNPQILLKMMITTGIAALITALLCILFTYSLHLRALLGLYNP